MNERFRELAQQSGIKFTPFVVDGEEYDFDEVEVEDSDMLQNFAELIIKECAGIAKKEQTYNDSHEIHVNIDYCILSEFGLKHSELTNE